MMKQKILKEKGEVQHMILTEYNEKKHMKTLYAQGREAGREEGREEERANTERERLRAEEAEKEIIRLREELLRMKENSNRKV